MQNRPFGGWQSLLKLLAGILILKVTVAITLNYTDYLPPNFNSDFLRNREAYFFGMYQWAFYTHIATGPITHILGVLLVSEKFRLRFPAWHRYFGRIQGICVLLLVAPSGLWMAFHAASGVVAAIGFSILSIATGVSVAFGWRAAVKRRIADHRRWMWRCFLLLSSAVVLRLIVGLATVIGVDSDWFDPLAAWISWLIPLTAFELSRLSHSAPRRTAAQGSLPAIEISARR